MIGPNLRVLKYINEVKLPFFETGANGGGGFV
jgi:hypothetical protein